MPNGGGPKPAHDKNCYFDSATKEQILDELSSVQAQLTGRSEFNDLVAKISDVKSKLLAGEFVGN